MKIRWAWTLPVLSIFALSSAFIAVGQVKAQGPYAGGPAPGPMPFAPAGAAMMPPQGMMPPPGMMPPGMPPQGMMPQGMMAMGPQPAMYGPPPGMMPAGGMPPGGMGPGGMPPGMMPQGGMPPGAMNPGMMPDAYGGYGSSMGSQPPMDGPVGGGPGGCSVCQGIGCDACGGGHGGRHRLGHGLLGDIFGMVGPYSDGGCAAVRWYDFSLEYMMLRRDDSGRGRTDFTSQGIGGPIVLDSTQIDFSEEPSFRFSAAFQIGPGSNAEFTYFGLFYYDETASVKSAAADDLFSVFSGFGTQPFNGFVETDRSDFQSINYESTFDSFEVNFRQRWMAPNCRYQGSWLWGARHFALEEEFTLLTQSTFNGTPLDPARANFSTRTYNGLTGFQVGADAWVCLIPGLRLGGEAKAGVYGNHAHLESTIDVNTGPLNFLEERTSNEVAFVGQADILATYRLNYQWTLKLGYHMLYVDGVALASENFNTVPPAVFTPPPGINREAFLNVNGNVFYHGYTAGLEFMW